jgi:hypothetical protein
LSSKMKTLTSRSYVFILLALVVVSFFSCLEHTWARPFTKNGLPPLHAPVARHRETIFNIDDFGADPEGHGDSYPAIQQAIVNASHVGGGIVYIPPGDYKITSPLTVSSSSIRIVGSTSQSSLLIADFPPSKANSYILNVLGSRGVVIDSIGFVCAYSAGKALGLSLENSFIVTLSNLQTISCPIGLWVDNTGNLDVMTLNLWGYEYAVRMQNLDGDIFLDKVHGNALPSTTAIGLYLSVVSGAKITNSDFIGGSVGVLTDLSPSLKNDTRTMSLEERDRRALADIKIKRQKEQQEKIKIDKNNKNNKNNNNSSVEMGLNDWDYNSWLQFLSVDCDTVAADPWHIISALGLQMSECWSGSFPSGTGLWLGSDVSQASIINHQWQSGKYGIGNNAHGVGITGGIMGGIITAQISSSVPGEPTVVNLRTF